MKKFRYELSLCEANLEKRFKWIRKIASFQKFTPCSKTFCILFSNCINYHDRKQFEDFIAEFYEVKRGRHQFICCWRELEVIVTVF